MALRHVALLLKSMERIYKVNVECVHLFKIPVWLFRHRAQGRRSAKETLTVQFWQL